jgi:hypothetical protein
MSLLDSLFRREKKQPKQTPEPQTEQNQAEQVQSGESEIREAISGLRTFLENHLEEIGRGNLQVMGQIQFERFEIIRKLPLWDRLSEEDRRIIETYIEQSKEVWDIKGLKKPRGYQLNAKRLAEALRNLLPLLRETETQVQNGE